MKQFKKVSAWLFMLALLAGASSCKEDSSDAATPYKVIRPLFYKLSATPDPDIGELELTWRWKQDPDQIERASSYTLQISTKNTEDDATFLAGMVQEGVNMQSLWSLELDPATLSYTFYNLLPDTKYFARIKAHDKNNPELDSPWCYAKVKTTDAYTGTVNLYRFGTTEHFPNPLELDYDDLTPIVVKVSTLRDDYVVSLPTGGDWLGYTLDNEAKTITLTPQSANPQGNPERTAKLTVSVDEGFASVSIELVQKKMQWRLTSLSEGMQFDETGVINTGSSNVTIITTDCPTGWTATVEPINVGDDVSWCRTIPTSGSTGATTTTVTADANPGVEPRSAKVVITAGTGSAAATISFIVNQFGGGLPSFDIPDFSSSSIYKVMMGTTQVGEICREYLRSVDVDAQAIVIYPMLSSGKADLTKGVVLQVNKRSGAAGSYTYAADDASIHGGGVSFDKTTNAITAYTAGTDPAGTKVVVKKDGGFALYTTQLLATSSAYTTEPYLFVDVRGDETNTYKMVKVATQYWMGENWRTLKHKNGNAVELKWSTNNGAEPDKYGSDKKPTTGIYADAAIYSSNSTTPGVFIMNNNLNNEMDTYGVMYNTYIFGTTTSGVSGDTWDSSGFVSAGWKLPVWAEYNLLASYIGADAGAQGQSLMAVSALWTGNSTGHNVTGFTLLPGGSMANSSAFQNMGLASFCWMSQYTGNNASNRAQVGNASGNNNLNIGGVGASGANGASAMYVRLLRVDE